MMIESLSDFNRVPLAAKVLTVNERTLYKMIEQGLIVHVRVGIGRGGIRITRQQVEAYLAANTHDVPPETDLHIVEGSNGGAARRHA